MKRLLLFVAILGLGFWGYNYFNNIYTQSLNETFSNRLDNSVTITINSGESLMEITDKLFKKKILDEKWVFKRYVESQKLSNKLFAGEFLVTPKMNIPKLVKLLTGEIKSQTKLIIPEGFTLKQIDTRLTDQGLITAGDLEKCSQKCVLDEFDFLPKNNNLEGYLFPDTYFINPQTFELEKFVHKALDNFRTRLDPIWDDIQATPRSIHEIITLASLIEKEAISDKERPLIADILWRRLDNKMALGVDATHRYYKGDWKNPLTISDLNDYSPYNTRRYPGLPPTPIAMPGLKSIKAVLYPKKNEYWYYLHDTEQKIHYTKTLDEHNKQKMEYF